MDGLRGVFTNTIGEQYRISILKAGAVLTAAPVWADLPDSVFSGDDIQIGIKQAYNGMIPLGLPETGELTVKMNVAELTDEQFQVIASTVDTAVGGGNYQFSVGGVPVSLPDDISLVSEIRSVDSRGVSYQSDTILVGDRSVFPVTIAVQYPIVNQNGEFEGYDSAVNIVIEPAPVTPIYRRAFWTVERWTGTAWEYIYHGVQRQTPTQKIEFDSAGTLQYYESTVVDAFRCAAELVEFETFSQALRGTAPTPPAFVQIQHLINTMQDLIAEQYSALSRGLFTTVQLDWGYNLELQDLSGNWNYITAYYLPYATTEYPSLFSSLSKVRLGEKFATVYDFAQACAEWMLAFIFPTFTTTGPTYNSEPVEYPFLSATPDSDYVVAKSDEPAWTFTQGEASIAGCTAEYPLIEEWATVRSGVRTSQNGSDYAVSLIGHNRPALGGVAVAKQPAILRTSTGVPIVNTAVRIQRDYGLYWVSSESMPNAVSRFVSELYSRPSCGIHEFESQQWFELGRDLLCRRSRFGSALFGTVVEVDRDVSAGTTKYKARVRQ